MSSYGKWDLVDAVSQPDFLGLFINNNVDNQGGMGFSKYQRYYMKLCKRVEGLKILKILSVVYEWPPSSFSSLGTPLSVWLRLFIASGFYDLSFER